ncbi:MAG: transglycosylase family protein [Nitriliruptorales bacterium]|nr:transglycosylase family protein [Nitriliruptorales bacterium]
MHTTTSALERWQQWRPFGVAKRLLTLTLALATVSFLLAFDAAADEEQATPEAQASTAASSAPIPETQIAATVGLALDDSSRIDQAMPAARERHEQDVREQRRDLWFRLADCESGFRKNGRPIPGSARWDYGLSPSHGAPFEGGLQFAPFTWDGFRDADMPAHAGLATPSEQIVVAERVLAAQGWKAWPVCSRMLGLRG